MDYSTEEIYSKALADMVRHKLSFMDNLPLKALGDMRLEVVGAPFGGPLGGKDAHGEYFSERTNFMIEPGDQRPVLYYHGHTPRGTAQIMPEVIGKATYKGTDDRGAIFDVQLDDDKPLAQRLWQAVKDGLARASSGTVDYLKRKIEETGEIISWPLAELSLIDKNEFVGRLPANDLATVSLKSAFESAGIEFPEVFAEAQEVKANTEEQEAGNTKTIEVKKMSEEISAPAVDMDALVGKAKDALREELEAEAKIEAKRQAELEEFAEAQVKKALADKEAEYKAWAVGKQAPAFNKLIGANAKSEGADEFVNWMRTGDDGDMKVLKIDHKALQEGSDTEGGYLVPDDFLARIIEKKEELSWLDKVGMFRMTTSRDVVNIPIEDGEPATFTVTAEEGAYTTDDPILGQVAVTIHKFTKLTKISDELLDDDATNLEEWYARRLAEKMVRTEEQMVATGTGSGQPQGVFVGGTAGLTFDSAAQIDGAEIPELFYKLQAQYRINGTWLMHPDTEAYLRGLRDANNWVFEGAQAPGVAGMEMFQRFYGGRPIFNETNVSTIATAVKTVLVGDFNYYTLVERKGLSIARNPFLYQANGQVGFFSNFRFGGAVTQAEAFQYGTQA